MGPQRPQAWNRYVSQSHVIDRALANGVITPEHAAARRAELRRLYNDHQL